MSIFSICPAAAGPLDYWSWISRGTGANTLYGIAHGNGVYVAVGDWGTVLTSRDGTHWKDCALPVSAPFYRIAFGEGLFVAYAVEWPEMPVGNSKSYLFVSADGEDWKPVFSQENPSIYGRSDYINDIIYTGERFIAVGGNDSFAPEEKRCWILTSDDGLNWSTSLYEAGKALYSVTYAKGCYAAVGSGGICMRSRDGVTWEKNSLMYFFQFEPSLWDIIFHEGRFVAIGNRGLLNNASYIFTSDDGLQWEKGTEIAGYKALNCLRPLGGKLLVTGEAGATFVSEDLVNWTSLTLPVPGEMVNAEVIDGGLWLCGVSSTILSTKDGGDWKVYPGERNLFSPRASASDGQRIAVAGGGGIKVWQKDEPLFSPRDPAYSASFTSIAYGAGKFVAAGDGVMVTSDDGVTWSPVAEGTVPSTYRSTVIYGSGRFVVVSASKHYLVSTDGIDWQQKTKSDAWLTSVAERNGVFVSTAYGHLYSSTDASDWIERVQVSPGAFLDVAYGAGKFVVVGDSGRGYYSSDGTNWTPNVIQERWRLTNLIFARDRFLAAGDGGLIFSSLDGVHWEKHFLPNPSPIYGLLDDGKSAYVVTTGGTLLKSDPLSGHGVPIRDVGLVNSRWLRLNIQGQPGEVFEIQSTTDFKHWESKGLLDVPLGRTIFEQELSGPQQFLRIVPVTP